MRQVVDFSPEAYVVEARERYNAGFYVRGHPPEINYGRDQAEIFTSTVESDQIYAASIDSAETQAGISAAFPPVKPEYDKHFRNLMGFLGKTSIGIGEEKSMLGIGDSMQSLLGYVYDDALSTYALAKAVTRNGKNLPNLITYLRASPAEIRSEIENRPPGSTVTIRAKAGSYNSDLVITRIIGSPVG